MPSVTVEEVQTRLPEILDLLNQERNSSSLMRAEQSHV